MPTTSKVSSSSKTKAVSKPATISKQFKSAELIEDSDDEDEDNCGRTPRKPVKNSIAIESKPKPPKIKPKALPVSVKSSPAIPNGKASSKGNRDSRSSVIISSSDSQTEDEESGTEETEVKNVEVDEDSEDEESSEGSSSGSENGTDSSSGDDERKSYDGVPQSKKTAPSTQQKQATSRKPVPQYELPSGFEPATITIPTSSNLTDLFSSNSLRNKQFWHIIVPSSVPINSLREVSTQSVQSGSSILTHEGADYGLISEVQGQSAKKTLLLPSAQANEYKSAEVGISQTFNLQQLIPDRRHGSSTSKADSITKYEKPVRQQPEGLKMRYRPFGDTEDSSEQSGSESSSKLSVRAPKFRKPISIETSSSSKKNMNHEESYVEMGGDTESVKKGDRRRHGKPLGAAQSSQIEIERDYTVSPKVSKKRKGPPESENGVTERPVKKNKRKVSLESVPDARNSPFSSNAVHPEASEGSKESKIQKEHSHAERNGIETPRKSHKHKVPLESVLVAEARLLDEKPNGIRKRIKTQPSVEPVSTNGYPDDTIMLDPPLSTPPKRKNGETSHHGEHQNAKPDMISVRKETKQDDEIIAEPIEAKRKSKKEKRRRERSEGNVNMPAGEATRSAKKAKTTSPAAETLTDAPTMTIKPENTTTAKTPQPPGKEKKRHRPEKKRSVSATTAPKEPPATPSHPNRLAANTHNTHSLGISNGKTPTPPAATPEQTKAPTAAAAAASPVLHHDDAPTSNPVPDRKKKRTEKKMKKSEKRVDIQS